MGRENSSEWLRAAKCSKTVLFKWNKPSAALLQERKRALFV